MQYPLYDAKKQKYDDLIKGLLEERRQLRETLDRQGNHPIYADVKLRLAQIEIEITTYYHVICDLSDVRVEATTCPF